MWLEWESGIGMIQNIPYLQRSSLHPSVSQVQSYWQLWGFSDNFSRSGLLPRILVETLNFIPTIEEAYINSWQYLFLTGKPTYVTSQYSQKSFPVCCDHKVK